MNIDTDNRMAITGQIRKVFAESPSEFDPRKFLKETMKAMTDVRIARYEAFGCAGHASKITAKSLEVMFTAYAKGELDQKIS